MLPEVGSTIVPPGFSCPSRSAASIIASPIRSFTDPPGFRYSSFARSRRRGRPRASVEPDDRRVADEVEDGRVLAGHAGRKPSSWRGQCRKWRRCVKTIARAGRFDRGDDLVVALRAARLDDRRDAGLERELRAVGEREERVRGEHRARPGRGRAPAPSRPRDAQSRPGCLAGADPDRLEVLGEHDRVRADVLAHAPGEEQVAPDRSSLASPQTSSMPSRSSTSRSRSWTSRPPITRL